MKVRARYPGIVSGEHPFSGKCFLKTVGEREQVVVPGGGRVRTAPTGSKGEWETSDQSQGGNNQGRWEGEEQIGDRREHSSG